MLSTNFMNRPRLSGSLNFILGPYFNVYVCMLTVNSLSNSCMRFLLWQLGNMNECGLCVVLKVKRFTKVVCSVVNLHNVF